MRQVKRHRVRVEQFFERQGGGVPEDILKVGCRPRAEIVGSIRPAQNFGLDVDLEPPDIGREGVVLVLRILGRERDEAHAGLQLQSRIVSAGDGERAEEAREVADGGKVLERAEFEERQPEVSQRRRPPLLWKHRSTKWCSCTEAREWR